MREIKFRGKRINNGEWVYGDLINWNDGTFSIAEKGIGLKEIRLIIPESVGEYTGLKDKNGVEIYEGDIVYIDNSENYTRDIKGKVVFEYGCFNVVEPGNVYFLFCELGYSIISIIGNIHENSERIN